MRIAKICVDGYGDVFIVRSGESLYRRFLLGCADGWHGAGGVRYKGRDGSRRFLSEIERFPWYDQAVLAERNPTLSPTVSVTDLKTDRSVFISVGLAGSQKVSYWVGYIYPVQKRFLGIDRLFRRVEMYETERMDRIIPIVKAFFGRDDQELRRRLAPLSPYLRVKESGGWSAYMDKKQQIVKQIK